MYTKGFGNLTEPTTLNIGVFMRNIPTIFVVVLVLSLGAYAQVPNGGFENWTNGSPDNWYTSNIQGVATPITQTSDAHSGSSALKGEVVSFYTYSYPPYVYSTYGPSGKGFAVSQRYAQLNGYYKFSPKGNDKFWAELWMWKGDNIIGAGAKQFGAASSYTSFSVPVYYSASGTPDSCNIWLAVYQDSASNSATAGSVVYIDDISLSGTATGIKDGNHIISFNLKQNYPNPFNPSTNISYTLPNSEFVRLSIYNIDGSLVNNLVNKNESAGDHIIVWNGKNSRGLEVSSGIYFYRITAGQHTASKKMILLK